MDKMWPALLKDGDTLRPATRPFIKCLVETKTNTRTTFLNDLLIWPALHDFTILKKKIRLYQMSQSINMDMSINAIPNFNIN